MRLFTALDLPDDVIRNIGQLIGRLKPSLPIHWSKPSNLHITTKFIGEWPEERLDELKAALAAIPTRNPLDVHVKNLGVFLGPKSPRNFWCGVEAPGLTELAADTEAATSALGIESESRPYKAHLTLARIKEPVDLDPLKKAVMGEGAMDFGRFQAGAFFLYRSQMKPGGSVYTKLAEFPLAHS
jgi:2'-5' RNA ligase